jgi:hypothetical protein
MAISIAPLLKQQSPSRHFGHGWIELPSGKRWNPAVRYTDKEKASVRKKPLLKRLFS